MTSSSDPLAQMAGRLRDCGWGVYPPDQYIIDMDHQFLEIWQSIRSYTLISVERAWALWQSVIYVCRNGISGDIAECGVWKGGACMLAALILDRESNTDKTIWLYDTFEGMSQPSVYDRIASSGQPICERDPHGWWNIPIDEVKHNIQKSGLDMNRFQFVSGKVEATLKTTVPQRLGILRLDTDWYESTKMELEVLYPRLVSGGVLIIDDYGHFTGARKAVDEYFAQQGIYPLLHRSDYTGRVMVKP